MGRLPSRSELREAFRKAFRWTEEAAFEFGRVGHPDGTIQVPYRPHYIFVRVERGSGQSVVQALNKGVQETYDYPIKLRRMTNNEMAAVEPDDDRAAAFVSEGSAGLGTHPHDHGFGSGNLDMIDTRRIRRGLVHPHEGLIVYIEPFTYFYNGGEQDWTGGTIDLTSYRPSTANAWCWVKVGVDPATNTAVAAAGDAQLQGIPLEEHQLADIDFADYIPIGGVKLRNGQTTIANAMDFADRRIWFGGPLGNVTTDHGGLTGLGDDDHPQYLLESTYDANSILKADSDNTPVALTMGASTILARLATGGIVAATVAQIKTLLAYALSELSGVLGATQGGTGQSTVASGDLLYGSAADTWSRLAIGGQFAALRILSDLPVWLNPLAQPVKNSSGATASEGDIGLLNAAGEYITTTTADQVGVWCAVVQGGANGSTIFVVQRGFVTIAYDGTVPSAGDFLTTSTVAGKAVRQTYASPGIFAVRTGLGGGGFVDVLLLTERLFIPSTATANIIRVGTASDTDFVATINAVGASTVTYNAPSSGDEATISNTSSSEIGNQLLHNTTDGNSAKIDSVNTGTNVITLTGSTPAGWAATETITARSQTNTDVTGGAYYYDIDLQDALPANAVELHVQAVVTDSGGNSTLYLHPYKAFNSAEQISIASNAAANIADRYYPIPLYNRRICWRGDASGAGTQTRRLQALGWRIAAP